MDATPMFSENAIDAEERDFVISILRTNLADVKHELDKGRFSRNELIPLLEQEAEIETALQLQEDYALAASLNGVEVANRDLIVQAAEDEENALADRQLAARLARMDLEPGAVARVRGLLNDTASVVSDSSDMSFVSAAGSTASARLAYAINNDDTGDKALMRQVECVTCTETYAYVDTLELDCHRSHAYCGECVVRWFKDATIDTSLFPPRCCRTPVELETARRFLDAETALTFKEKAEELTTPNPTYCNKPDCSKFIKPARISYDIGLCATCGTQTCTMCKGQAHTGLCPEDPTTQALLDIAEENKWQRCYNCKNMVELGIGCNHMTCRCLAEFCYVCGVKWKECGCDQWDENNLLEAAEREAARDGGQGDVAAAADNLRQNHDCRHPHFRHLYQNRGHDTTCHMCPVGRRARDGLAFIPECTRCGLRACRRCINNRLR